MEKINIISMMDNWLVEQDKKKLDSRDRKSHHPSGANKCMRQLYYDWTGQPVSDYRTATDIWRMNLGTWMHKMFAHYLKEMGEDVQDEVEMTFKDWRLKYPIHGYMDNVIMINGVMFPIELKTVFGYGGKAIQLSGQPREDDATQEKIYIAFNNFVGGIVAYLARDSFYRTQFIISMSKEDKEAFKEKIILRFMELEDYVDRKVLPKRDYQAIVCDGELLDTKQKNNVKYKSDWQCMYCVYRSACYREELDCMGLYLPEAKIGDES